jgi:Tol biopolymer transport system component
MQRRQRVRAGLLTATAVVMVMVTSEVATGGSSYDGPSAAAAPTVALVSLNDAGDQGNAWSGFNGIWVERQDVSAGGRYVVFGSRAANLVPGDTNDQPDVFLRDTVSGTTERISVGPGGVQANERSYGPLISADGRYVAFSSRATNLVRADRNHVWDAYVYDRVTHATRLVSRRDGGRPMSRTQEDNRACFATSMSDDGNRIVVETFAPGSRRDTNRTADVFVRDVRHGRTLWPSHNRRGRSSIFPSESGAISGDGRFVVFTSMGRDLLPAGEPRTGTVYRRNLRTDRLTVMSYGDGGVPEERSSDDAVLSRDGSVVAFTSISTNLLPSATPAGRQVYVRDIPSGQTWRVAPAGAFVSLSSDGGVVAFDSGVDFLAGDTNGQYDAFVWDRSTLTVSRVNVTPTGGQSTDPRDDLVTPTIDPTGVAVVFASHAGDLVAGDDNGFIDVFLATGFH